MKIQRSCTYLHKIFAVRELKKALDFCSSRTHVRHLSYPNLTAIFFERSYRKCGGDMAHFRKVGHVCGFDKKTIF